MVSKAGIALVFEASFAIQKVHLVLWTHFPSAPTHKSPHSLKAVYRPTLFLYKVHEAGSGSYTKEQRSSIGWALLVI